GARVGQAGPDRRLHHPFGRSPLQSQPCRDVSGNRGGVGQAALVIAPSWRPAFIDARSNQGGVAMSDGHVGFDEMRKYPLFEALFKRRSRRIGLGVKSVPAGSNTYTSNATPQPLSDLEEAILISAVGLTGLTLPDRPFETTTGEKILGTPNLNMPGRAAGSTDNCQATHFFLFNDSGTYFLKRLDTIDPTEPVTPALLIRRANASKVKLSDKRPEFPREFPYYLDSNPFLSNPPVWTVLCPSVDMTQQYINALMYLLPEPDAHRPAFLEDRNFSLPAGVRKWIRSGFLNKEIKLPLGVLGT